ncbi:MAG: hypothetical protein WBG50_08270 [Desulfomonilaceae bacterium]
MSTHKTRDFLIDHGKGLLSKELMLKYHLSHNGLEQIFRILRRSDLLALRRLWEQDKLTDAEFSRAFDEVENRLCGDEL